MSAFPERLSVVDSHTEGEPTRVVVDGWPPLEAETMEGRRVEVAERYARLCAAVVFEPRGHDAVVGALLTPPVTPDAETGVVFFNNVGPLWMCGHGTIGVVRTLEFLGRVGPGSLALDTPAGRVGAGFHANGDVTIENVPASCYARDVTVDVPGLGPVVGDVAYGGNWFYLTRLEHEPLEFANVARLTDATRSILEALARAGVTGAGGAPIDHVEVFGPPVREDADSRNFVLCPGGAYDRSPCGTGTSAKLAVLHARGQLEIGATWRQESITGSRFTAWLARRDDRLVPCVRGSAFVTGHGTLVFDPADPFRTGFSARAAG